MVRMFFASVVCGSVMSAVGFAAEEAPLPQDGEVKVSASCQGDAVVGTRLKKLTRRGVKLTRKLVGRASGLVQLAAPPYPQVKSRVKSRMSARRGARAVRASRRSVSVSVN